MDRGGNETKKKEGDRGGRKEILYFHIVGSQVEL